MGQLDGKNIIVTGATGGIGSVACRTFCREGASVVGCDLDEQAGRALERELAAAGLPFRFRRTDVSSQEDVAALVDAAMASWDAVDVLFNNAGIILGKPLLETTAQEWDRVHDVNLKSVFLTTVAVAPVMSSPGGSIINVSSIGGAVAFQNMSAYSAAKAGVIGFSRAAATDLAPGIRVNALLPGTIDTPMPRRFIRGLPDPEKVWEDLQDGYLVGRLGRPEEIVAVALFLASDAASFVTGTAITADGGWSTR